MTRIISNYRRIRTAYLHTARTVFVDSQLDTVAIRGLAGIVCAAAAAQVDIAAAIRRPTLRYSPVHARQDSKEGGHKGKERSRRSVAAAHVVEGGCL